MTVAVMPGVLELQDCCPCRSDQTAIHFVRVLHSLEDLLLPFNQVSGWGQSYFTFLSTELPLLLQIAQVAQECGSEAQLAKILAVVRLRTFTWAKAGQGTTSKMTESFAQSLHAPTKS